MYINMTTEIMPMAVFQSLTPFSKGQTYKSGSFSTKDALTLNFKWNTDALISVDIEQSLDGNTWGFLSSSTTSSTGTGSRWLSVKGNYFRVTVTNVDNSNNMTFFRFFSQLAGPTMGESSNIRNLDRETDNILVYGAITDGTNRRALNIDTNGCLNVNVNPPNRPATDTTELTEIKNLLIEIKNSLVSKSNVRKRY